MKAELGADVIVVMNIVDAWRKHAYTFFDGKKESRPTYLTKSVS